MIGFDLVSFGRTQLKLEMTDIEQSHSNKIQTAAVLFTALGCLSISLYLRTFNLSFNSYWIDEMSSIHFAGHQYWGALFWDNSPPLYHLLLKFWMFFFGASEAATRSLSGLFSVATTVIWMRAGYRRGGIIGLMWCGLIHSVLGLSITHARETRMYALFELTSTVFFVYVLEICEGNRVRIRNFIFSLAALLLSHFLAIFPIGIGLTAILVIYRRKEHIRPYVIAMFSIFVLAFCCLPFISWSSLSWQEVKFDFENSSRWPWIVIGQTLAEQFGTIVVGLLALILLVRKSRPALIGTIAFVACFAIATAAGFAMSRAVFLQRYFIFVLPLVMLVILGAQQKTWHRKFDLTPIAITILLALILFAHGKRSLDVIQWENPPWDETAVIINASERPIVFTTRPLSLRSPYFDNLGIEVLKLKTLGEDAFLDILQATYSGHTVWILENSWGIYYYDKDLNHFISTHGCSKETRHLRRGWNDILVLLKISCPLFTPLKDD